MNERSYSPAWSNSPTPVNVAERVALSPAGAFTDNEVIKALPDAIAVPAVHSVALSTPTIPFCEVALL